jgi:hypothetical protein
MYICAKINARNGHEPKLSIHFLGSLEFKAFIVERVNAKDANATQKNTLHLRLVYHMIALE